MKWLLPWYSLVDNPEQQSCMVSQLRRELDPGHTLYELTVRALARRQDCDDVLFEIEDSTGRVAVVHLTWTSSPPERPPRTGVTIYNSFEAWKTEGMRVDHDEFYSEATKE